MSIKHNWPVTLLPVSDAKTDTWCSVKLALCIWSVIIWGAVCSRHAAPKAPDPDSYQRIWSSALHLILTWYMFLIILLCDAEPFQEAQRWMFYILAGLFASQQLHWLSSNCQRFCRAFSSPLDAPVCHYFKCNTCHGLWKPFSLVSAWYAAAFFCCFQFSVSLTVLTNKPQFHPHILGHVMTL